DRQAEDGFGNGLVGLVVEAQHDSVARAYPLHALLGDVQALALLEATLAGAPAGAELAVGSSIHVRVGQILVDDVRSDACTSDVSVLEPRRGITKVANGFERVRHDHDCLAGGTEVVELLHALALE